jgi:hypothetical protein
LASKFLGVAFSIRLAANTEQKRKDRCIERAPKLSRGCFPESSLSTTPNEAKVGEAVGVPPNAPKVVLNAIDGPVPALGSPAPARAVATAPGTASKAAIRGT